MKVELERCVEDVADDRARIQVLHLRRVEAGLGGREGDAQRLDCRPAVARAAEQAASAAAGVSRKSRRRIRGQPSGDAESVDVDVLEEVARERMAAIADQPGLCQVVDVAMAVHLVGHVDDKEPLHLADRRVTLGAIGQLALQVVERVVLRAA